MAELLIRPGINDHEVIQDLLAPGGAAILLPNSRPLIDRLVIDAHVAQARPELAEAASAAGVGVLIDPLTPLWQGELRAQDKWAQLPFGTAQVLDGGRLGNPFVRKDLTARAVSFQADQGATAIIPPYPYVSGPNDPMFQVGLDFIRGTARYMREAGIALPMIPVLCAQLQRFGGEKSWRNGIDHFTNVAVDLGPESIALCLSPAGNGADSYNKVRRLFAAARHVKQTGVGVVAWRQGVYGHGLVAAGLDGYETGIGTREQCNIAGSIASRKPPKPGTKRRGGGPSVGIYIEPLRRSVSPRVGETLLGHRSLRPKVMCDDERCCPDGAASTLDQRRHHAVRSRAREMAALEAQPHVAWRLHQVAKDARAAQDLAIQANRVLREAGIPEQLGTANMASLAQVTEHLQAELSGTEAA
jgi:hypothetical protein